METFRDEAAGGCRNKTELLVTGRAVRLCGLPRATSKLQLQVHLTL